MASSGTEVPAPHHPPASAICDAIFLTIFICAITVLIMSFSDSLSRIMPPSDSIESYLNLLIYAIALVFYFNIVCGKRSRRCRKSGCEAMKDAMEIDFQIHREDSLRNENVVDPLPWKGGAKKSPDYEWLRAELRKIAPINGRAVLIFRNRCGCPVSKLIGWGPSRRRNNRVLGLGPLGYSFFKMKDPLGIFTFFLSALVWATHCWFLYVSFVPMHKFVFSAAESRDVRDGTKLDSRFSVEE